MSEVQRPQAKIGMSKVLQFIGWHHANYIILAPIAGRCFGCGKISMKDMHYFHAEIDPQLQLRNVYNRQALCRDCLDAEYAVCFSCTQLISQKTGEAHMVAQRVVYCCPTCSEK